jgi:hypothetical protein
VLALAAVVEDDVVSLVVVDCTTHEANARLNIIKEPIFAQLAFLPIFFSFKPGCVPTGNLLVIPNTRQKHAGLEVVYVINWLING